MKYYTSQDQTAKLIELGFEKPKGWCVEGISSRLIMYKHKEDNEGFNYSIGELIEMLERADDIEINRYDRYWSVSVGYEGAKDKELIDVLFAMIVKLKEEGVI